MNARKVIQKGSLQDLENLLNTKGFNAGLDKDYMIRESSRLGKEDFVARLLKDPNVDPAALGNKPLMNAVEFGHVKVFDMLVADERVDPTDNNNRAVFLAANSGREEMVKRLLALRQVNPADRGNMALMVAVERGHLPIVKLLLNDSRVTVSSKDFYDPAWIAYTHGRNDVLEFLMSHSKMQNVMSQEERELYLQYFKNQQA